MEKSEEKPESQEMHKNSPNTQMVGDVSSTEYTEKHIIMFKDYVMKLSMLKI